ncbi:LPXTG cell wall anchor domain-containing protein [Streptomyces peucetius]|uniref:LPXTG cell wall anchor domain-containing protein n=1 Tax=Streptomyces peucetius TaxID=1950 RepID=A0ABY6I9N6_STRPE|nr:LPXTG cell wall anchor domain-containing protein [Streptomyces peucetius]UYQ62567.1 LPXTG cell wall anchor domain-containing protein [Streptomyces peucetius]
MRILRSTGTVVAAAALSLSVAPAAFATNGDNGNVKIHDVVTGEYDHRNNPKVCTFYLDSFQFDGAQKVDWHIEAWANNDLDKGTTVKSGSLTLDGSGHERTEEMTLADGQYKLFWTFEGQKSEAAKHKVFKVDCDDEETPGEDKPGDKPGDDKPGDDKPGEKPGEKPGDDEAGAPAESPAASEPADAASPSAVGATGDLAETGAGAPVGALAAAAAALVGVGGYLLARRRTARQH